MMAILRRVRFYLIIILICIFLIVRDVEHLFICLLGTYMSHLPSVVFHFSHSNRYVVVFYCGSDLHFLSPTARHPGIWSQVGLRKHHYKQSYWRWWNSSWALSNPERWCCESAALNMPANLEKPPVATGLEEVSFHSNPKERQWQRMLKLLHNCTHLTR